MDAHEKRDVMKSALNSGLFYWSRRRGCDKGSIKHNA